VGICSRALKEKLKSFADSHRDHESVPANTLAPSSAETSALREIATAILDANFDRYLHFSDVDPHQWKLIKAQSHVKVYSSQPERQGKRSLFRTGNEADNSELQSFLFVGSTQRTLENIMHRLVDLTIATARDELNGTALLSVLQEPIACDPFTAVAIKWMELDVRRQSMGLLKNRDFVYVETSGVKCLPSGERLGYHVMHSVDVAQAVGLPDRVRAKLSVCSFFRQVSESSVSVYSMAMLDPMSDRVRRVVVPRFTKTLLSTFRRPQPGKIKQLAQALGKSYLELTARRSPNPDENCNTCNKRVSLLEKLTNRHGTCKIEKTLRFAGNDKSKKVAFCFSCLTDVMAAHESEFRFEDSDGDPQVTRRVHQSVWASRLPDWSVARSNAESSVDFSSTR
jgi:hypothetical protein